MRTSIFAGDTLKLIQGDRPGHWRPETRDDAELLRRVLRRRAGDPVNHPATGQVQYLIAHCASRGVSVVFEAAVAPEPPPSPSPGAGKGSRRKR